MDGNTAIVGAPYADNLGANGSGAAFVFVRSGSSWSQQAKLKVGDPLNGDWFGVSVAIAGNTAVVGAHKDDNVGGIDAGEAVVFERTGTSWNQKQKLIPGVGSAGYLFGSSVAISGDTIVVGARRSNSIIGSAYVYQRNGTTWNLQSVLTPSNGLPAASFGGAVAIDGDFVVVGASLSSSLGQGSGSGYIYERVGSIWIERAILNASNGASFDYFGTSVAISGDTVVVGAPGLDIAAGSDEGAAYAYTKFGATWSEQAMLTALGAASDDAFGSSVALLGDVAVVGVAHDDTAAGVDAGSARIFARTGTNWIEQTTLTASDGSANKCFGSCVSLSGTTVLVGLAIASPPPSGESAYVYAYYSPWVEVGSGLGGISGIPQLAGTGSLQVGSTGSLHLSSAAPSSLAVLFVSLSESPVPLLCGTLFSFPITFTFNFLTDSTGATTLPWPAWPVGLSGFSLYFQYVIQDSAGPCGVSLSNALRANVP